MFNVYVSFHFIQGLLKRIINLNNFQTIIVSLKYRVIWSSVRYDLDIWPSILMKGHCLPFKLNLKRKRHFSPLFSYVANISTTNIKSLMYRPHLCWRIFNTAIMTKSLENYEMNALISIQEKSDIKHACQCYTDKQKCT